MRQTVRIVLALLLTAPAWAQTVTPRGDAATLDVASWNLEFFGTTSPPPRPGQNCPNDDCSPNDAFQFQHVEAVIAQGRIDVWGLQEVSDGGDFGRLLDSLAADGYTGVLGPSVSSPVNGPFDQKLAFVYNAAAVTRLSTRSVTEVTAGNFGGRLPFQMRARVTVGAESAEIVFVSVHAEAGSGSEDCASRRQGAAQLKAYLDGLVAAGESVVLLGDLNDELASTTCSGASPYAAFLADDGYIKTTLATEQAGLATFCGSDDTCGGTRTIDHILTAGYPGRFIPAAGNAQRQRYGELLSDLPQYTLTTSDHLPVLANLTLGGPVATDGGPEGGPAALLAPAPSPFRDRTLLRFRLDAPSDVRLDVFDALGRRVASLEGPYGAGEHPVPLAGDGLAPGVYVVRLAAGGVVRSQLVVRAR